MRTIPPRQLQVFVAVARTGSVSAAAQRVHLSQPATSMALAQLEQTLGSLLFDRSPRQLLINARGRELLPRAEDILDRLAAFASNDEAGPVTGELRLGTSNTVGNYRVAELLAPFVAVHPQVGIEVEIGNTDHIVAALVAQHLDVACVEETPRHPDLVVSPWRTDALAVCVGVDHHLAGRRRLRPQDLAGARWILREPGSATRRHCERMLAHLPIGQKVLELGQTEAIKQAVIAGLGMAFLPMVAVDAAAQAGQLAILPTPFLDLARPLSLMVHRQRYRSRALRAFLSTVQGTPAKDG